ncbi:hypothetical protein GCM10009802_53860 [Streptomyces synnematoformans]|uniref:Uncharacterized protein n=1 Tax=Streptomyces synnematoformans TaxID=415721 RepID=A0ABP4K8M0_9ACTN
MRTGLRGGEGEDDQRGHGRRNDRCTLCETAHLVSPCMGGIGLDFIYCQTTVNTVDQGGRAAEGADGAGIPHSVGSQPTFPANSA